MVITERYEPLVVGVNATQRIESDHIGLFVCQTTGTITITSDPDFGSAPVPILTAFPVTTGVIYPIPFYLAPTGGSITTAGGASGTLGA